MSTYLLALIQNQASPLAALADAALIQAQMMPGLRLDDPPLPDGLVDQAGLVLWDMSGLSAVVCRELAEILAPIHLGVIILTQRVLPSTRHLAAACGALQVVTASCGPQGLATALRLAALTQSGILAQWRELQDIRQETADRLVVEEAKRLVMREAGMGESQAMRWLQKRSRDSNQKMPDLARKILSG